MSNGDIDGVGRAILYVFQEDIQNMPPSDIIERTKISDSTVRRRIQRLESEDAVKGYSASVDYRKSGYPLRMLLYCTTSIPKRGELVPGIPKMDGVVAIQELIADKQNLLVTAVCETDDDITAIAQELLDMGATVADEVLVRTHKMAPSGGFDAERHAENGS